MKNFISLVFIIILAGCGRGHSSKQSAESSALEQGFELVDQGQYDEALLYFQKIYENKPSDDALKAWASVYVARAGFKVASLYKAFSAFPSGADKGNNILVQIQSYKKSLDLIPFVKGEARADLQTAATLLEIRKTPSVRLFRGILNLVLLRSTFSDGDRFLLQSQFKLEADKNLKTLCQLDWKRLRVWLQAWTLYGLELKKDLELAYPQKQKNWNEGEKFFIEARKFSTTLVKECH